MSTRIVSSIHEPHLAECHGENLLDIDKPLWDMFVETAAKYPSNVALVSLWQQNPQLAPKEAVHESSIISPSQLQSIGTRFTYSELLREVECLAGSLQELGCIPGENIVVLLWNSWEWAIFFWVAARMRITLVTLDPRAAEGGIQEYLKVINPRVIVVSDNAAALLSDEESQSVPIRIIASQDKNEIRKGWETLCRLTKSRTRTIPTPFQRNSENPGSDIALVVFTSGTTSTPKGCPHTAKNLWSSSFDFDPNSSGNYIERWLIHTPVWHIMGVNNALRTWRYGGSVILPAKTFDITASIRALKDEQCTRMAVVPTLVKAMLGHPQFPPKSALALQYISIGGTTITEDDINLCEGFGSATVSQAYGMSEGAPVTGWKRDDPLFQTGFYAGVGRILPGCRMRICTPDTRQILYQNEIGELHIGGTSVITGYLNGSHADSFYVDEAGSWCKTGDQAFIDQNNVLHINGRLKDLIIRGGENISPAPIEDLLSRNSISAQVVGAPDEICGEILIAVVKSLGDFSLCQVYELVKGLGSTYALDNILTLEELGLDAFPITVTGKISKAVLKQRVKDWQKETNPTELLPTPPESKETTPEPSVTGVNQASTDAIAEKLRSIWLEVGTVNPETNEPVTQYADSITMLRFCNTVAKRLCKKIYLTDLLKYRTIEEQAEFLSSKDNHISLSFPASSQYHGPPTQEDLILANDDSRRYNDILRASYKTLAEFELNWEKDIEAIIPIRESLHGLTQGSREQSFQHRMLFQVYNQIPASLHRALENCLSAHPMFRAILTRLPGDTPFHLIARPSNTLYDHLIIQHVVPSMAEVYAIHGKSSYRFGNLPTTQMFQASIITMEDSNSSSQFLSLAYNHSTFDALTMISWNRDLETALLEPQTAIIPQTPFKMFADLYHTYQSSPPAMADVRYFTNRLRGISRFPDALWPQPKGPGWMCGDDRGSEHYEIRKKLKKQAIDETKPNMLPRVMQTLKCPNMKTLTFEHQLRPQNIVKAAIALFNVQQTDEEYVIFSNMDSGRDWPFLLPWMRNTLPSAMSIDGPTIEYTLNMLRISRKETIGELLQRIQEDQEELSKHCHAPWFKVLEGLGEEASVAVDALRRQCFNWDISLQYLKGYEEEFSILEPIARSDWPDCGIFWMGGMLNEQDVCLAASFDDVHLSSDEVENHVATLLDIVLKLTDPRNWNLKVSQVFGR